jgi:hypothetical protein
MIRHTDGTFPRKAADVCVIACRQLFIAATSSIHSAGCDGFLEENHTLIVQSIELRRFSATQ